MQKPAASKNEPEDLLGFNVFIDKKLRPIESNAEAQESA